MARLHIGDGFGHKRLPDGLRAGSCDSHFSPVIAGIIADSPDSLKGLNDHSYCQSSRLASQQAIINAMPSHGCYHFVPPCRLAQDCFGCHIHAALFCNSDIPLDAIQALLCYVAYSCVG